MRICSEATTEIRNDIEDVLVNIMNSNHLEDDFQQLAKKARMQIHCGHSDSALLETLREMTPFPAEWLDTNAYTYQQLRAGFATRLDKELSRLNDAAEMRTKHHATQQLQNILQKCIDTSLSDRATREGVYAQEALSSGDMENIRYRGELLQRELDRMAVESSETSDLFFELLDALEEFWQVFVVESSDTE